MSETFDEVRTIIGNLTGAQKDSITPDTRIREDLWADSLDLIEVVLIFEDLLGMRISDQDIRKIQDTVGTAAHFLEMHR